MTSIDCSVNSPVKILFLGATGYIGGSILGRLIEHPARGSHSVICYLRNEDKAKILTEQLGIKTIIGTLDDTEKIENAAVEADVVIHTAESADHIESVRAILRGLKRKYCKTSKPPIYFHTSGAGVVADDSKGGQRDSTVYNDSDIDQLKSIPDDAMHRNVDLVVAAADDEGYVRTYTVAPPVVYGLATGPLFDLKLANPHTVLVLALLRISLARGRSGMIGNGENVWPLVHIKDLANLYILLLDTVLSETDIGHGWNGIYLPAHDSCMFKEFSKSVGHALVKLGKISEGDPDSWSEEEIFKFWDGSQLLGGNVRYGPTRALDLGWSPQYTKDDFLGSIYPEAEAALASGALDQEYKLVGIFELSKAEMPTLDPQ